MNKEDIIHDLIDKIKREALPPGHWLVERDLSEIYGISRTPVREILRELVAAGLVEQQPGKGYRIKELRFGEIVEIFSAREAVEGMATRLACQLGNQAFFDSIDAYRRALDNADVQVDPGQGIELGRNLHDRIVEAAGNAILSEFYLKLKNLTVLTRNLTKKITIIEVNSKTAHLNIIESLAARDPDRSEAAMREHLRETCRGLIEGYLSAHAGLKGGGYSITMKGTGAS